LKTNYGAKKREINRCLKQSQKLTIVCKQINKCMKKLKIDRNSCFVCTSIIKIEHYNFSSVIVG